MGRLKVCRVVNVRGNKHLFQFHNGSIKSKPVYRSVIEDAVFQFHNGSIKSRYNGKTQWHPMPFQFHNGSIKSRPTCSLSSPRRSFNSTMVRLKVDDDVIDTTNSIMFQFHNGSIKRQEEIFYQAVEDKLQFHNGSIKSISSSIRTAPISCFNSTMVRLKA